MNDDKKVVETAKTLRDEIFEYLHNLRDSGKINMFGAADYLMREFCLSRNDAQEFLIDWMNSFND